MFTLKQEKLLIDFANLSDELFELGIITTDSFTGEIGEYIACKHFNLKKSNRVTRDIDGVCALGNNYQVKSKVISNNNFNYSISGLDPLSFQYLIIIYFDKYYSPIKIIRIPSNRIIDGKISITKSFIESDLEIINKEQIKIPNKEKSAITKFAEAYIRLEENEIIRSRRIVGDIGEFYACRYLDIEMSKNRNEKGIDAKHKNGLTFEIKTRRVYESERRKSNARRLNNLVGKCADYVIVVALDRAFRCIGMWLIPMKNIFNPKSAHLGIVNTTIGTLNLIPSKIPWLKSREKFVSFNKMNS